MHHNAYKKLTGEVLKTYIVSIFQGISLQKSRPFEANIKYIFVFL
jgi:hypothetical protein